MPRHGSLSLVMPHKDSLVLARLHAALDSVETTHRLVAEIQRGETLTDARADLAGVSELVDRARALLRGVIAGEAA
jgi:hypothetical protein